MRFNYQLSFSLPETPFLTASSILSIMTFEKACVMIRAFDDYEITGIEPIISATEATMGHACMSESFNQVVTTTEEGSKLKNILKKTISSINSVEGLVSLGANGVTLLEFLDK